jgi:hypothetical protein
MQMAGMAALPRLRNGCLAPVIGSAARGCLSRHMDVRLDRACDTFSQTRGCGYGSKPASLDQIGGIVSRPLWQSADTVGTAVPV